MLNFNSILLSSENPERLVAFYEKVFEKKPDMNDGDYKGFMAGSCFLTIGPHDKVKGESKNPERIIFNFETADVKNEADRVSKINGGKVVTKPYSMGENNEFWIATFQDPDGNFFQLITPWEGDSK